MQARNRLGTFALRGLTHSARQQKLFDWRTKTLHKVKAAQSPKAKDFDYLRDEVATRVVDRLQDITRPLPHALDIFCGSAHILRAVQAVSNPSRIESLTHCDMHPSILSRAQTFYDGNLAGPDRQFVLDNEQAPIPIEDGTLDLVISSGALHWVNDLPLLLRRAAQLLKPDGLFLAAMFGGDTLQELRISLQLAEDEMRGRLAPRISPMVRLRDAAGLVSGAGLALTTADVDRIIVPFTDMFALMRHLKGMGETNALTTREIHYGRKVFERASRIYEERYGFTDEQGRKCVPATFEVVHMNGWAPAVSQPRAKERGSAQFSIGDLTDAAETVVPATKDSS